MAEKSPDSSLKRYREMRDFKRTPEPSGTAVPDGHIFVIQKHAASHLHYDFRLRLHGALKSWALSKGPSLDPNQHRLASQTEDHPIEYAAFEGVIPAGNYGAGTVLIWDRGTWEPLGGGKGDYYRGRLRFLLHGERLKGTWSLVRKEDDPRQWILTKEPDEYVSQQDPLLEDTSVVSGRNLEEIAADRDRLWTSDRGEVTANPEFGHPQGGFLPVFIEPQAATLAEQVPEGDAWLHEIKFDGYRMVCRIDKAGAGIRFYSRKGYDFTDRLPTLKEALAALPVKQAWLDGEIVVQNESGGSDFHALQEAFRTGNDRGIVYLAFDLMVYEGYDIRSAPLYERKALLADLMPPSERVRYVDHVVGQGREFYEAVCGQKLEGVLSKQVDAEYLSQRTRTWLKVKCEQRQEFVVGGYTESGAGRPFGSLLAGYYDQDGNLVFAGKIKTGYSIPVSRQLLRTMEPYRQQEPPFVNPPSGVEYRNPQWLRPELVAEVAFTELSASGLLRHASFKGLREDKDAREVRLERPVGDDREEPEEKEGNNGTPTTKGAPKGDGSKAVFPKERISREEVEAYYRLVAPRMLPFIADRPLTLIVCRTNIYACSFKKHATNFPAPVKGIDAGHEERYIAVDSPEALLTLVRLGAVEFHAWQSRYTELERPDRLLFDLDPPEDGSLPWEKLAEGALLLRLHLQEYRLETFLQTTGGKGYYVVAPLLPTAPWGVVTPFAKRVAREMEAKFPDRFTAELEKEKRGDRIFVDWMRNGRGSHAAEPYSLRARPGAPVSAPITWEELVAGATPAAFDLRNMAARLEEPAPDPWAEYFHLRQELPSPERS